MTSDRPLACPDGSPHEWGYTYTNLDKERYTKSCSRCGAEGELEPYGECLVCGHFLPLAIWRGEVRQVGLNREVDPGVCFACRTLAESNRGPCSYERGCACQQTGRAFSTEGGASVTSDPAAPTEVEATLLRQRDDLRARLDQVAALAQAEGGEFARHVYDACFAECGDIAEGAA